MTLQDRLKELSMDLHFAEISIFKENIQEDKTFKAKDKEIVFKEMEKTRKQIEQLLYLLERYKYDR